MVLPAQLWPSDDRYQFGIGSATFSLWLAIFGIILRSHRTRSSHLKVARATIPASGMDQGLALPRHPNHFGEPSAAWVGMWLIGRSTPAAWGFEPARPAAHHLPAHLRQRRPRPSRICNAHGPDYEVQETHQQLHSAAAKSLTGSASGVSPRDRSLGAGLPRANSPTPRLEAPTLFQTSENIDVRTASGSRRRACRHLCPLRVIKRCGVIRCSSSFARHRHYRAAAALLLPAPPSSLRPTGRACSRRQRHSARTHSSLLPPWLSGIVDKIR